ncbi:MAG: hypothetical protein MK008_14660 [Bdellovibrionales bacterium]|nr:hypothetical protein [Bdellovibrionales bacterium]
MKYDLSRFTEKELLKLRLCDLKLNPSPFIEEAFFRAQKVLQQKQILIKPHYWISEEWFCPDGVTGMAFPFYLCDPILMEMEERYTGEVEGVGDKAVKYIFHELGHVIDNAYLLRQHPKRVNTFGSSFMNYPTKYKPKPYSKKFVQYLPGYYAQAHPEEDFAESFAVWIDPKVNWRLKYKNWPAIKKLKVVHSLMREIRSTQPSVISRGTIDPINIYKITLGDYYKRKKRRLKSGYSRQFDQYLKRLFISSKNMYDFDFNQNNEIIYKALLQNKHIKKYEVHQFIKRLTQRRYQLRLNQLRYKNKKQLEKDIIHVYNEFILLKKDYFYF